jgi:hypothetical protein
MTQAPSVVEQRPEVGLDELYPRILRYVRSVRAPRDCARGSRRIPAGLRVVSPMSKRTEDTMSTSTRILTGAAVAGAAVIAARKLGPKAHEACMARCGPGCCAGACGAAPRV